MPLISRGFRGRRDGDADPARLPPGQYLTRDFPVLSAGPTPRVVLDEWSFTVQGAVDAPVSWTWAELLALPAETFTVDIHCVTKWTKLDTTWKGVSLDTLLEGVETEAEFATAYSDGDYTTNLAARGPHRTARPGSRTSSAASRSSPSTAGRSGCSSRTSTSGRAPSGCAGSP